MNTCPNCKKENTLRPFVGPVNVRGVEVLGRGLRCSSCGEILFSASDLETQEKEVATLIVKRGIRTGDEFKLVRKVADLKATEVAELLDVRPETVSRWERGEVEIPRAVAFALGELHDRPRVIREKLEAWNVVIETPSPPRSPQPPRVRSVAVALSGQPISRAGEHKPSASRASTKTPRKTSKHG